MSEFRPKPNLIFFPDYKPDVSCAQAVLLEAEGLFSGVPSLPQIVEECTKATSRKLGALPAEQRLPEDEAMAIMLFTFELGWNSQDSSGRGLDNFHLVLQTELRERVPQSLQRLKAYMFYLLSGIAKQPVVNGVVFRGVPSAALSIVQRKYREKRVIHWPNFTLTSVNLSRAKGVARWPDGIIFEINVRNGRSLRQYSLVHSDDEVILSPNCRLVVVRAAERRGDGFHYLMLSEEEDSVF